MRTICVNEANSNCFCKIFHALREGWQPKKCELAIFSPHSERSANKLCQIVIEKHSLQFSAVAESPGGISLPSSVDCTPLKRALCCTSMSGNSFRSPSRSLQFLTSSSCSKVKNTSNPYSNNYTSWADNLLRKRAIHTAKQDLLMRKRRSPLLGASICSRSLSQPLRVSFYF